jgi:flagellar motility protein MotE (MotC chaperone)
MISFALHREAAMQTRVDSADREKQREQLYALRMLLEEALRDSNELHHRIREIQLRVAQLSAWVERGDLGGFANVR